MSSRKPPAGSDEALGLRIWLGRISGAFLRFLEAIAKAPKTIRRLRRDRGAYRKKGMEYVIFDPKKGTFRHFGP